MHALPLHRENNILRNRNNLIIKSNSNKLMTRILFSRAQSGIVLPHMDEAQGAVLGKGTRI